MSSSMSNIVQQAHQRFCFLRETRDERAKEEKRQRSIDFPPVFNKRLFIAKSNRIIITREARKVLERTRECMAANACRRLTDHEIRHMSYLVEVLSLIHHNLQYVKECLCYVVTYESHDSRQYVEKLEREECLSCFYIVGGRVEVTYDRISLDASVHVHERNLIYTQGPGEYLGLVSHEGEQGDLEPPSTMYTLEPCEFIRVDRQRFHETMEGLHLRHTKEKRSFLSRHQLLKNLPTVDKERLIPGLVKQVYPANKVIVRQGETADSIYFVSSGRCQFFRKLYLKQTGRDELFKLGDIEEGDVFGGESVINGKTSSVTVSSAGIVTCYRINSMQFNMTARENLIRLILGQPKYSIDDSEIRSRGCSWTNWQDFRRANVIGLLKNSDHSYLIKNNVWLTRRPLKSGRPQTCQFARRVHRRRSPQRSKSVPATFTHELPVIDGRPYLEPAPLVATVGFNSADETDIWNPNEFPPDVISDEFENNDMTVEALNNDSLFPALTITNKELSKKRVESREFKEDWFRHSKLSEKEDPNTDEPEVNEEVFYVKSPVEHQPPNKIPNIQFKETDLETDSRYSEAIYEAHEKSKQEIYISKFRMNCLRKILRGREEKRKRAKTSKYTNSSAADETLAGDFNSDQMFTIDFETNRKYDQL